MQVDGTQKYWRDMPNRTSAKRNYYSENALRASYAKHGIKNTPGKW